MDRETWLTGLKEVENGVQNVVKHPLTKLAKKKKEFRTEKSASLYTILDLQDIEVSQRGEEPLKILVVEFIEAKFY